MFLDYKEKKIIKIRQELFELQNFEVCFLTNFRYRSLLRIYKDQMAPFWVKSASKRQFLCFIVVKSIWNALKPYIFWNVEVSQIFSKSQNSIIFFKIQYGRQNGRRFYELCKAIINEVGNLSTYSFVSSFLIECFWLYIDYMTQLYHFF